MGKTSIKIFLLVLTILLLWEKAGHLQEEIETRISPQSFGYYGNFYTISQLLEEQDIFLFEGQDTFEGNRLFAFYQYFELAMAYPKYGVSFNTFLRYRDIFNGEEESFDVYNAYLQFKGVANLFDIRLGRQIITESNDFILMDGGWLNFYPLDWLEFIVYGGVEPEKTHPEPSQPFERAGIIGVKMRLDPLLGSIITLGYERFDPNDFSGRNLLNFSFQRVLPFINTADIYSRGEVDLTHENLQLITVGLGVSPIRYLYFNFEYSSYEPDEDRDRDEFPQDAVFDLFSVGRLHEARVGVSFIPTQYLVVSSKYSFARYDFFEDEARDGNIVNLVFSWDFRQEIGLSTSQEIYFIDNSHDGTAVGVRLNVFEEIIKGFELQFSFAYAHFETISNQEGNAQSYIFRGEYLVVRNLALKAGVEINSNPDFDIDVRTDLGLNYYFSRAE